VSTAHPERVVVATHGHCFDGLCSAVMFTRLYGHLSGPGASFTYHGAGYGPGQNGVDPKILDGDVNAILDFRFSTAPQLTWYFDHHVSAFVTPTERAAYEHAVADSDASGAQRRMFHDGSYSSATKLIADMGRDRFGLDPVPMADLVKWADMIDSAAFPNAKMAVERKEPELQLMTVVEHMGDDAFLAKMVPRLLENPLFEVARSDDVARAYEPLRLAHETFVKLVAQRAEVIGTVVLVDLTDEVIDVAGKFVTYALHPESAYSVLVSRSRAKCKISIGYNPWSPVPRRHNIAAICERYGGGGHPVVGAVTLPPSSVDEAKRLARSLAEELAA
jgi:hypothetical protein